MLIGDQTVPEISLKAEYRGLPFPGVDSNSSKLLRMIEMKLRGSDNFIPNNGGPRSVCVFHS